MKRHEVNQAFLDLFLDPAYLEIGVDQGVTFHQTMAARKVGVDVRFAFDWKAAAIDPANAHCTYYEMTSDDYFANICKKDMFDYIFIDGLHSYEQTLRDLLNATLCVKPNGIIVVDDVLPSGYAASLNDLELSRKFWATTNNPDKSWMGDVFRLAFFIETFMPAFNYATVAENHGQMIIWRQSRFPVPQRSVRATCDMEYVDSVMRRESFVVTPIDQIKDSFLTARANS